MCASPEPRLELARSVHRARAALCAWAVSALLASCASCSTLVEPPAATSDPVTILLLDWGDHSSLLLPGPELGGTEFTYGEWEWFALGHQGWWRVPAVLFWPRRGALGRREWTLPAAAAAGTERSHALVVERGAAESLRLRLEARFQAGLADRVVNPAYGLEFVPDDDSFWIGHTCNAATADWLRELGCRVSGSTVLADYRVARAGAEAEVPCAGQCPSCRTSRSSSSAWRR